MSDFSSFFLYTPFPWLSAMYVAAYRHDIGRIARPFRDSAHMADWWSVCKGLKLIDGSVKMPADELGRWSWLALFATVFISMLWTMIPFPLAWYELTALQVAAALPLFLVLASNFGPFPYKPYRDFLPYPRRGTRVRHLKGKKQDSAARPDAPAVREEKGGKVA